MDSRGRGLQKCFNRAVPGIFTVIVKKGCDISTLLKIANRHAVCAEGKFNIIIIAGVICSITMLNKKRKVRLRHITKLKLLEEVSVQLDIGLKNLRGDNPKA